MTKGHYRVKKGAYGCEIKYPSRSPTPPLPTTTITYTHTSTRRYIDVRLWQENWHKVSGVKWTSFKNPYDTIAKLPTKLSTIFCRFFVFLFHLPIKSF